MARPPIEIDLNEVEKLAKMQCSAEEMAAWFGCSKRTWITHSKRKDVRDAIERGRGLGRCSLRHAQFQAALKGNITMLIWLGKTILGQTERIGHEVGGPGGKPIEIGTASSREEIFRRVACLATGGTTADHIEPGE